MRNPHSLQAVCRPPDPQARCIRKRIRPGLPVELHERARVGHLRRAALGSRRAGVAERHHVDRDTRCILVRILDFPEQPPIFRGDRACSRAAWESIDGSQHVLDPGPPGDRPGVRCRVALELAVALHLGEMRAAAGAAWTGRTRHAGKQGLAVPQENVRCEIAWRAEARGCALDDVKPIKHPADAEPALVQAADAGPAVGAVAKRKLRLDSVESGQVEIDAVGEAAVGDIVRLVRFQHRDRVV
jgi:hypothetical protein